MMPNADTVMPNADTVMAGLESNIESNMMQVSLPKRFTSHDGSLTKMDNKQMKRGKSAQSLF